MDTFERAYAKPLLAEDPMPAAPAGPMPMGVAPATSFSLHGCVLTPLQRLDDAWVDVEGSQITRVGTAAPAADFTRIETGGIILPGLIDLHGHPEYNVFAAWEPPRLYLNRGQWRDSKEYAAVVKVPVMDERPLAFFNGSSACTRRARSWTSTGPSPPTAPRCGRRSTPEP